MTHIPLLRVDRKRSPSGTTSPSANLAFSRGFLGMARRCLAHDLSRGLADDLLRRFANGIRLLPSAHGFRGWLAADLLAVEQLQDFSDDLFLDALHQLDVGPG